MTRPFQGIAPRGVERNDTPHRIHLDADGGATSPLAKFADFNICRLLWRRKYVVDIPGTERGRCARTLHCNTVERIRGSRSARRLVARAAQGRSTDIFSRAERLDCWHAVDGTTKHRHMRIDDQRNAVIGRRTGVGIMMRGRVATFVLRGVAGDFFTRERKWSTKLSSAWSDDVSEGCLTSRPYRPYSSSPLHKASSDESGELPCSVPREDAYSPACPAVMLGTDGR